MILWSVAVAGVELNDPTGCVNREALMLELSAAVGDELLRGILVKVDRVDQTLVLGVRGDEPLWDRVLDVPNVDCPVAADLVARSVAQGLAELPDWRFEEQRKLDGQVLFGAGLALRSAPRWELRGGACWPVGPSFGVLLGLGAGFAPLRRPDGVGVDVFEVLARGGFALDLWRGLSTIRLGAELAVGPAWLEAQPSTLEAGVSVVPMSRGDVSALWRGPGLLRVGATASTPINQLSFVRAGDTTPLLEPSLRVGLMVGVGGSGR